MTVGDAFKRLGNLLSLLEAHDIEVVAASTDQVTAGEPLGVELRLRIPSDGGGSGLSLERVGDGADADTAAPDADVATSLTGPDDEDGGAEPSQAGAGDPETAVEEAAAQEAAGAAGNGTTDHGTADEPTDDAPTDDPDDHACDRPDCDAGFDSADALTVHRFVAHEQPDEPLHRHEPALAAAYRAYDSFPEMTDALGVDVTPQTVRRNMIDHGLHDPEGAAELADGDASDADTADGAGTPAEERTSDDGQAVTDGSGATTAERPDDGVPDDDTGTVPEPVAEGVTAEALREAVVDGGSLRAAAERLDRGRGETRQLLSELGLLELVHGRLSDRPDRAERREAFESWLAEHPEAPRA